MRGESLYLCCHLCSYRGETESVWSKKELAARERFKAYSNVCCTPAARSLTGDMDVLHLLQQYRTLMRESTNSASRPMNRSCGTRKPRRKARGGQRARASSVARCRTSEEGGRSCAEKMRWNYASEIRSTEPPSQGEQGEVVCVRW